MSKQQIPILRREFSPREAENVTGVSVTLQRDWRRRGLLPEQDSKGWAKFSISDIIEMLVMKSFSESGLSVQSAREFSRKAVNPTMKVLFSNPDAINFEGFEISSKLKEIVMIRSYAKAVGRYLIVAREKATGETKILQCNDFNHIDEFLQEADAVHCMVIDCERIAKTIVAEAGLPIAHYEGFETDESG